MRSKSLVFSVTKLELILYSFDADLPVICNDEGLNDGVPNFRTDASPPTRMHCFVAAIQLNQILGFALRTIVCPPSLFTRLRKLIVV